MNNRLEAIGIITALQTLITKLLTVSESFAAIKQWLARLSSVINGLKNFNLSVSKSWQKSFIHQVQFSIFTQITESRLRLDLSSRKNLREIVQSFLILLIVLMPVIQRWEYILIPLCFLWFSYTRPSLKTDRIWVVLIVFIMVSTVWRSEKNLNFQSVLSWLSWLVIYCLTGSTFKPVFSKRIIQFITISSLIWITIGIWQQWGTPTPPGWLESGQNNLIAVRSYSVFKNPNNFALYLLSIILFAMILLKNSNPGWRIVYFVILTLATLALIFTYSRSAWIIGSLVLAMNFSKELRSKKGGLIGVGVIAVFLMIPGFIERLWSLKNILTGTMIYRLRIWQGVWKAISDDWLWGSGPGSFPWAYPWYQVEKFPSDHAHQFYLQFWLEYGLVSLLILIFSLRKLISGGDFHDESMKSLKLILLVFLFYGFMETWTANSFLGGYFWLVAGIFASYKSFHHSERKVNGDSINGGPVVNE